MKPTSEPSASSFHADLITSLIRKLRRDEPEIGHLHAAIQFKQSLVEQLGVEAAFQAARKALPVPGLDELRARPVVSLRNAGEQSLEFVELWPGGHTFVHPSPRVVGEGDHEEQRGISRSGYLTSLEGVAVRGRSSTILAGKEAVLDFESNERTRFSDNPELDASVLFADGDVFWTMEPDNYGHSVNEAFMISGKHTHDFGHWVIEYLPMLAIALMADLPGVPFLVDERMPRTHSESLELFAPDHEILVIPHVAPCRVKKLWCASKPSYRGYYPSSWSEAWPGIIPDPQNFATTIRKLKSLAADELIENTGHERVFLARRPERKKRLVNHGEIETEARKRGFLVVYPEDLSFLEQLRLVHHARFILAPEGSNGLLSYFASPGGQVCFLNSQHTYPLVEVNGVLGALGMDFTIVTGPVRGPDLDEPFWSDYEIDRSQFCEFLDEWLDGPSNS